MWIAQGGVLIHGIVRDENLSRIRGILLLLCSSLADIRRTLPAEYFLKSYNWSKKLGIAWFQEFWFREFWNSINLPAALCPGCNWGCSDCLPWFHSSSKLLFFRCWIKQSRDTSADAVIAYFHPRIVNFYNEKWHFLPFWWNILHLMSIFLTA